MLSLDEALERVFAAVGRLAHEQVPLGQAFGRVLGEDLAASVDLPRFDHSAMDGYAVSVADFQAAGPFTFPVSGESRAGHPTPGFAANSACRIFTGAPLPAGADAVILQEDAERDGASVRFAAVPRVGDHIRRRGEDLKQGTVALARGTRLGAFELGLVAALDRSELTVSRRPTLAIISSGDELRSVGEVGAPGSIPESNAIVIEWLARAAGARVEPALRVGDDRAALAAQLGELARRADVVVTIGGASVGDHDLLRPALADAGAVVDFWKVRIKPGKPLFLGRLGDAVVLGLPGNPVSAQLTFVLFGLTLLRALQGDRAALPERGRARLASPLSQKPGRLGLYRARLQGDLALPFDNQASGSTASLAHADAVVLVPADSGGLEAGASVEIIRLPKP